MARIAVFWVFDAVFADEGVRTARRYLENEKQYEKVFFKKSLNPREKASILLPGTEYFSKKVKIQKMKTKFNKIFVSDLL